MNTNPVSTRRKFFWKAGAAISAPLVFATAAGVQGVNDETDVLRARLAEFEDETAIRGLHQAYAKHVNARSDAELVELFVDPSDAQLDASIRNVRPELADRQAAVVIAADRQTATARIPCVVEIATPIDGPGWTLVDMARRQGDGVLKRTASLVLEQTYVRRNGGWKISRSQFRSA